MYGLVGFALLIKGWICSDVNYIFISGLFAIAHSICYHGRRG